MSLPTGSDGTELKAGTHVRVGGISEDSLKSLMNGRTGVCEKWDAQIGRMFVRVSPSESQAFSAQNLCYIDETELDSRVRGNVLPPRGSGGMLLGPGTIVRVHGFSNPSATVMNNQEGICERWDKDKCLMSVRLRSGGAPKAINPKHLRKVRVHDDEAMEPDAKRALEIFQGYDQDGDGLMEMAEFKKILIALKIDGPIVDLFLMTVDKNHDKRVGYDEFLSWALSPVDTSKLRVDQYWPEDGGGPTAEEVEALEHPAEAPDDAEMEQQELEKSVGALPAGWPKHGMAAVNNVRIRFPDCPLEDIVKILADNKFMGGLAIAAIRKTGAKENDAVRKGAIQS